jgi:hypothetical protein
MKKVYVVVIVVRGMPLMKKVYVVVIVGNKCGLS